MFAIGVYAEPCQVHMGLVWIKALTLQTGHANVIGHVDQVLGMLAAGNLDPRRWSPITSRSTRRPRPTRSTIGARR